MVKIFADGADLDSIKELAQNPIIKGFTTNPTLMRQAGVTDYRRFADEVTSVITDRPISFEVFADELDEMEKQARVIASWAPNINVKIPITNTRGESTAEVVRALSAEKIVVNVTAMFTMKHVRTVCDVLAPETHAILSVFAGRIADGGIDPMPIMTEAAAHIRETRPNAELLWASPREVLNVVQADQAGCGIITVTGGILSKMKTIGKDMDEFSLDTVKMFYNDAQSAGYTIQD